jgi:hypothetical protein
MNRTAYEKWFTTQVGKESAVLRRPKLTTDRVGLRVAACAQFVGNPLVSYASELLQGKRKKGIDGYSRKLRDRLRRPRLGMLL